MNRVQLMIIALFSLITVCSYTACANSPTISLYDFHNAHTLSHTESTALFGPKAGHIRYDNRMVNAARIATARANAHSHRRCWAYVKNALVKADVVNSRPTTEYAKQAGAELMRHFGFQKINVSNPFNAPIGAVIVYGGHGAGHVEIRTAKGFVSDFASATPSHRPLIGVYVKPIPRG